jgi:sugar O-acyltransferase (sialic acid O-acetyltransferase NeuD family)
MTDDIWYVYGAGGLGVETMDILQNAIRRGSQKPHRLAFLVDAPKRDEVIGLPVVAVGRHVFGAKVTIAVGEPADRALLLDKVATLGLTPSSIISPDAFVSAHAEIGVGTIVAPHCSIQATARIGRNVAVNTGTIVGHDVVVEDNCVLSSMVNLGGGVHVGTLGYIGMGALIKEKLQIGHTSIVGMGSVVHSDVPEEVIALGNPARVVRRSADMKVFK